MSYNELQLRQLVQLAQEEGGVLSADQLRAVLAWDEMPEELRDSFGAQLDELERQKASWKPEPLSPDEEAGLRERGVLDDDAPKQ